MTTETIVSRIKELRRGLDEVDELRNSLPKDAFAQRAELLDREHRLRAELAMLKEVAADRGAGSPSSQPIDHA